MTAAATWAALQVPVGMALAGHPWRWAFFVLLAVLAALAVATLRRLAALDPKGWQVRFATPLLFGVWVLLFWELLTQGFDVPKVLLPAPTVVWASLLQGAPTLQTDFVQTVLHSVLIGLALGSGLGFVCRLWRCGRPAQLPHPRVSPSHRA